MTFDPDWLRPAFSGFLGAVAVAVLAALVGKAPADKAGWRRIAPGPMHWISIVLGAGLVLLLVYVRLFVGSARSDAAQQMAILTWLIAAFGVATIAVALSVATIRRRAVRWRGARVVWHRHGRDVAADLATILTLRSNWLGHKVLGFECGEVLWLDPYARGARELLEAAEARLPRG